LRKKIRNKVFTSKSDFKNYISGAKKWEKIYHWIWKFLTRSLNRSL
jgi:hypothetical protein